LASCPPAPGDEGHVFLARDLLEHEFVSVGERRLTALDPRERWRLYDHPRGKALLRPPETGSEVAHLLAGHS